MVWIHQYVVHCLIHQVGRKSSLQNTFFKFNIPLKVILKIIVLPSTACLQLKYCDAPLYYTDYTSRKANTCI